jgi:hypothetical protein
MDSGHLRNDYDCRCLAPMSSANALRLQIERALESRFPAALSPMPQSARETAAVGIAEIDRLLSGGFPNLRLRMYQEHFPLATEARLE